jgi:hypothetical protein
MELSSESSKPPEVPVVKDNAPEDPPFFRDVVDDFDILSCTLLHRDTNINAKKRKVQDVSSSRPDTSATSGGSSAKKKAQKKGNNSASLKECLEELEMLARYVNDRGGKRDLLEGWSARRYTSGQWYYTSEKGTRFKSPAEVARELKLPRAPKFGGLQDFSSRRTAPASTRSTRGNGKTPLVVLPDPPTADVARAKKEALEKEKEKEKEKETLEKLSSYVVFCGGKPDLVNGWSAKRKSDSKWSNYYYYSKEGKRFGSRPEVARWLKLPGAPKATQRDRDNTGSQDEAPEKCTAVMCNHCSKWRR